MSKVIVMTKAQGFCPQCKMVKKFLNDNNIEFEELPVTAESEEFIRQYEVTGYRAMPIVFPSGLEGYGDAFTGFDIKKLRKVFC